MSASNKDREFQFSACLLMLGPKPGPWRGNEADVWRRHKEMSMADLYAIMQESFAYRDAVERWYCVHVLQPDELRSHHEEYEFSPESIRLLREGMDGKDSWIDDFYSWQDRVVSEEDRRVH